jgi:hypothetical protein
MAASEFAVSVLSFQTKIKGYFEPFEIVPRSDNCPLGCNGLHCYKGAQVFFLDQLLFTHEKKCL